MAALTKRIPKKPIGNSALTVLCGKCGHSGHSQMVGSRFTCARCGSGKLRKVQYCKSCGHVGVPDIKTEKKISAGLLLILLSFGILPGVIYLLLGGSSQKYYACVQCQGRGVLIPVDSPIARAALEA